MRCIGAFTVSLFAATWSAGLAQETPSDTLLTVDHYLDWERVGNPQLSPDGTQIVYTRSRVNRVEDRWDSQLWMMSADGSKNRFLLQGSNPQWSPDGSRLAYTAPGEPAGPQIFVRWMDEEGATSQITHVTAVPMSHRWSPDSRSVAFVMLVPEKETWDISMPAAPEGATWTAPPRMVSKRHYRGDRMGYHPEGFTHLFVVPAHGGTPRQITRGSWHVGARFSGLAFGATFDWTPDGQQILFDGLMADDADYRERESYIYAVNLANGTVSQVVTVKGRWTGPAVSPDGREVAFTGFEYTTQMYRATDVYAVGLNGRDMRKISANLDRDPGGLHWAKDGSGVFFTAQDRGSQNVHFASTQGSIRAVTEGVQVLTLSSMAGNGTAVGTRSSFRTPEDIVRFDGRRPQDMTQLTHVNDDVLADKRLGDVEEIWYTSTGNARIQGWIVKPPSFDPNRDYPLILSIHGGPNAMYNVGFNYGWQNWAANGYVVLYTNPRGSTGYGTDFGNSIDNAYPSIDHEDLMVGVDSMLGRGYIDADRLFIGGCSGGGILTSWAIGHTDRFAAAAVLCPVINWISLAGTTDIQAMAQNWMSKPFWEDPQPWLEHSPLMHVGKVTTPTLLMTGVDDLRTPMGQTEEYYAALKTRGVPAVMLRFNGEAHGTSSRPSNFMRTQLYMMSWFQKWDKKKQAVSRR